MRKRLSRTSIFDVLLVMVLFGGIMATALTMGIELERVPIVAAIAASLFSVAAVLGTYMTVQEMRVDRIERNKPFVFVDFPFTGSSLVFYVIRNMGSSIATDVTFEFDPVPVDFRDKNLSDLPFFQNPIPILAPGVEYKSLFHVSHELLTKGYPNKFKVHTRYKGELGENYSHTFEFDLGRYKDSILPPKTVEEHLKSVEEHLDDIAEAIKRLSSTPSESKSSQALLDRTDKSKSTLLRSNGRG